MNDLSDDVALDLEEEIAIQSMLAGFREEPLHLDPSTADQLRRRLGPPER